MVANMNFFEKSAYIGLYSLWVAICVVLEYYIFYPEMI